MKELKNLETKPKPQIPKTPSKPKPSVPKITPHRRSDPQPPRAKPVPDRPKRPGKLGL